MRLFPFLQTIRARLTLWNMLVLALVLIVLGAVLRVTVEFNLMASIDENITSRAEGSQRFWGRWFANETVNRGRFAAAAPRNNLRTGRMGGFRPMPAISRMPSQWQARMQEVPFDLKGNRLFSPNKEAPFDQLGFDRAVRGNKVFSIIKLDDVRVRILSQPLRGAGKIVGVVQVGYALDDVDRALSNLNTTLLTLVPFALFAAGIGGLLLTWRMLRPIREVTEAAGRIGADDLSQRLPVYGTDEFSKLAITFNETLGRLEQSFEQQRRFTADASHELRSPLTVIKANASLALSHDDLPQSYRKSMESVDKAAGVMNRVVQDLLLLARSDTGQLALHLRPTSLSAILETAVVCVQKETGPAIRNLVEDKNIIIVGDESHLTRLFVNLLDNAIQYTPDEGCITISARVDEDITIITVEDTGIGIPPEHLPHICERFYRVDEARLRAKGGTGLGLAICQNIARAHGGSMDITSFTGMGTKVWISLSAAQQHKG